MMLVCFFILLYGVNLYNKGKKQKGLMFFFFFLSGGFHLLPGEWLSGAPINKYPDFALLYLFFVCTFHLFKSRTSFFSLKKEMKIVRLIMILLSYISIEFVVTVLFKREFFGYALAVYRVYLLLGSVLLVRELSFEEIKKTLIQIGSITLLTTILFTIQPILGTKFLHHAAIGEDAAQSLGIARYRNIPYLAYFFLIYATVKLSSDSPRKIIMLTLFAVALLLTQHRGIMIGYIITVIVYLIIDRKVKRAIQFGLIGSVMWMLAGSFLTKRFAQDDTSADIENVLNLDYRAAIKSGYDLDEGGTFSFRILLLLERIDFMFQQPKYLLTGVGTRHEDSPKIEEFNFILGTRKPNFKTGLWEPCQISSADLAWMTPLMRFGFIGLFMHICIAYLFITYFYKNRKQSDIAMSAFLFYILLVCISFKNDHLFADLQMFYLYLLLFLIKKGNIKNNNYNESLNFHLLKGI